MQAVNPTASKEEVPSVVESLKSSFALFRTPDMMAFSFTLFYTGNFDVTAVKMIVAMMMIQTNHRNDCTQS